MKSLTTKLAWRDVASSLTLFGGTLLIALFMINFVFRSYNVSGLSMNNTLQNGDKLIIWKGSRTLARLTGNNYIPKRGDIIVFTQNNLTACGQQSEQLIKRVVGLPGERVVVANGTYTIYTAAHPQGFNPDKNDGYAAHGVGPTTSTNGAIDVKLGPDQVFVSGDNRPDSCDSRAFGPVNVRQIIGKLELRIVPLGKIKVF